MLILIHGIMGHKRVNWKTIVFSVVYFCITHFWTCKITSSLLNTLGAVKNKTLRFSWITQPRMHQSWKSLISSTQHQGVDIPSVSLEFLRYLSTLMGRVPTQHPKVPRTGPSILKMSQTSSTTLSERLPLKHTKARGSVQHALASENFIHFVLNHTGSVQYQTSSALVRLGPTKALL